MCIKYLRSKLYLELQNDSCALCQKQIFNTMAHNQIILRRFRKKKLQAFLQHLLGGYLLNCIE